MKERVAVKPQLLRARIDGGKFLDASPVSILGQERAREALALAFQMPGDQNNVFLLGPKGAGKTSLIKSVMDELNDVPSPDVKADVKDWCYVFDFGSEGIGARWLSFPPGRGKEFKNDIRAVIRKLIGVLPIAANILKEAGQSTKTLIGEFGKLAEKDNIGVVTSDNSSGQLSLANLSSWQLVYLDPDNDRVFTEDFLKQDKKIPDAKKRRIRRLFKKHNPGFKKLSEVLWNLIRRQTEKFADVEAIKKEQNKIISRAFKRLLRKYGGESRVKTFLSAMEADIKKFLPFFARAVAGVEEFEDIDGCRGCAIDIEQCNIHGAKGMFSRYEVNLFVDNSLNKNRRPVLLKNEPAGCADIFGELKPRLISGRKVILDHMGVLPGALHLANGGVWVLRANELLVQRDPVAVWRSIVHAIKEKKIEIESPSKFMEIEKTVEGGLMDIEPIPLVVRIVLVGSEEFHDFFTENDNLLDFERIVGLPAEMDTSIAVSEKSLSQAAGFIKWFCEKEKLLFPDGPALGRLLELFMEEAESQEKLSLITGPVKRVIEEANFVAKRKNHSEISREDVVSALRAREHRMSLVAEKYMEHMLKGFIKIQTEGGVAGQTNALAVLCAEEGFEFGVPHRVTASVFPGDEGVVSAEKEVRMSGPAFQKALLIFRSLFMRLFNGANFSSQIVFEQNYGEIEGDSATLAEFGALLSAVGDIPTHQGIAITGSMDQRGDVQPIGSVNQKIRGFFDLCRQRGFTGEQGVIIPKTNLFFLMLPEEIVEMVDAGRFHVWAVERFEEAAEILMGLPFGGPKFSAPCIYKKVLAGLKKLESKPKKKNKKSKKK